MPIGNRQLTIETRKEGIAMKRIRLGPGITIFLVFFGVATLEAFQTRSWLKAGFWLVIGLVFLIADNLKSGNDQAVN